MQNTYYGRTETKKPKQGIHYMIFEEAIRKSYEKESAKFQKECDKAWKAMKKEMEAVFKDVMELKDKYAWIAREFDKEAVKRLSGDQQAIKEAAEFKKACEEKNK